MGYTHGQALLRIYSTQCPDGPWRWPQFLKRVKKFPPWMSDPPVIEVEVKKGQVEVLDFSNTWSEEDKQAVRVFLDTYLHLEGRPKEKHWQNQSDNYATGRQLYKEWVHDALKRVKYNQITETALAEANINLFTIMASNDLTDVSLLN